MNTPNSSSRRAFMQALTAAAAAAVGPAAAETPEDIHARLMKKLKPGSEKIVIYIYPGFADLDAVGPHHLLSAMAGASVKFIAATRDPVRTSGGYSITPQLTFGECPEALDLILVPGGTEGTIKAMEDPKVLDFLRLAASRSRLTGSVCTGSMVLAAAGLLKGRRATSHWQTVDLLKFGGAIPEAKRVVKDGNIVTAAGVTAGMDLALELIRQFRDDFYAQGVQLFAEYDPQPPFPKAGNAATAERDVVDILNTMHGAYMTAWGEKLRKVVEGPR